jgi:cobalt-zinc-cadmium efflux system membrane fusion protein
MSVRFPRYLPWAAFTGAAVIFLVGLVALPPTGGLTANRPRPPDGRSGAFTPTKEEWAGLATARVATRIFRPEEIADGNIAIDDDLTTPVFSPYSSRVEATEFVQAANDLIAAVGALKTARAQLAQAERRRPQRRLPRPASISRVASYSSERSIVWHC